jgi:quinol monooxygenase YgiN
MAYVVSARWLAHEGREGRVAEPRLFWLYEQYADEAAYEAHMASEHFIRLVKGEAIPELLESREREYFATL